MAFQFSQNCDRKCQNSALHLIDERETDSQNWKCGTRLSDLRTDNPQALGILTRPIRGPQFESQLNPLFLKVTGASGSEVIEANEAPYLHPKSIEVKSPKERMT